MRLLWPVTGPNRLRRPTLRTHLRGRDEPGAHQNLFRRAARRSIRPTYLPNPGPPQKSKTEKSPLLQVGSRAGRLAAGRLAAACSLANFPQRRALLSTQSERGAFFFSPVFFPAPSGRPAGMMQPAVCFTRWIQVAFRILRLLATCKKAFQKMLVILRPF